MNTAKEGFGIFAIGIVLIGISTIGVLLIGDSVTVYCGDEISDLEKYGDCLESAGLLFNGMTLAGTIGLVCALIGIYIEIVSIKEGGLSSNRERPSRVGLRNIERHTEMSRDRGPVCEYVCTFCKKEFKEFWKKCPVCGDVVKRK